MRTRPSTHPLATLAVLTLGMAACGSGESSPDGSDSDSPSGPRAAKGNHRERITELVERANASTLDYQEEMRREVSLPSSRRLLSFLPASLPDYPFVNLETELEENQGTAEATGRYQLSRAHYRSGIEIRVTYYGKEMFNGPKKYFEAGLGERMEVSDFEAVLREEGSRGEEELELDVRVSPEVYVRVSGPGSRDLIRGAAAAVDLAGLEEAIDSELLFEPTREDRLEASILSRSEIEALIPPALGPQELGSVSSVIQLDESPMHSRATGRFGQGQWSLYDYGDPEVAGAIDLNSREDHDFAMTLMRREDEPQKADLEVSDGHGNWSWLEPAENQPGMVALRAVRGRFVLSYSGPFLPEKEVAENMPEAMRSQLEQMNRELGVGAFASIEDQCAAVLAAFEALELES